MLDVSTNVLMWLEVTSAGVVLVINSKINMDVWKVYSVLKFTVYSIYILTLLLNYKIHKTSHV